MKFIFFNIVFYCLYNIIYAQSLSERRYFVVDLKWTDDLFNLKEEGNTDDDRFSISVQDEGEFFAVDEQTGVVRRNNDWGVEEREISIQINVNRQPDVFTQTINIKMVNRMDIQYNNVLLKNQPTPLRGTVWFWTRPGTVVMTVQAIDSDFHKDGKLIYELTDDGQGRFAIDNLGNIYVKGRKRFDGQYNLAVAVYSKGTIRTNNERTVVQPVTIFTGSIRPQFYKEKYNIKLEENKAIGSNVATIEIKSFQSLRVSVSSNDLNTNFFQLTEVYRRPGASKYELRNERKLVYGRADTPFVFRFFLIGREEVSNFVTEVEAVITLVDVNEPPFFTVERYEAYDVDPKTWSGMELTVYENDFGNKDPINYGDQVTWNLDDTENFELTNAKRATIHERSWTVQLKVKFDNSIKYGDSPDHTRIVRVTAMDNGQPSLNSTIDCLIRLKKMNSEPPIMEPRVQTVKVSKSFEGSSNNPIYVVQAYDPDGMAAEESFTFSLNNNFGNLFEIRSNTGELFLTRGLNNNQPTYELDISIRQGSLTNSNAGKIVIQLVNINQPPKFEECKTYMNTLINENREPGETVTRVGATDNDVGPAGELTYSFVRRDQGDEQFFSINATTGLVTSKIKFDRENPPNGRTSLRLTVQATDKGKPPQATNCFFFVKIGDDNDIKPRFDAASLAATFYAPVHLSRNAFIAQLYAYDTDEFDTDNAIVDYEVLNISPECSNCFSYREYGVNSLKTYIIEAGNLRGKEGTYDLTVKATDRGSNEQNSLTTIKIIVTNKQENYPPVIENINQLIQTKDISETISGGEVIAQGKATNHHDDVLLFGIRRDQIPLLNSRTTFKLVELNEGKFEVIFNNGKTLDREVQSKYLLIVSVTANKAALYIRIPVVLEDENNKSPEFQGMDSSDNYRVLLPQNTAVGEEILSFIATDEDSEKNDNNKVKYEIEGCTSFDLEICKKKFTVSTKADKGFYFGSLLLGDEISAEDIGNQFKIDIVAKDGSNSAFPGQNGPNQNKKAVRLDITGISSDSPKFPAGNYIYDTSELAQHGLSIANITAATSNEQYDQFVEKTYSITGGNENRWFTVDPMTGNIYVAGNGLISIDDLPGNLRKVSLEYKVFDGAVQSDVIYINITINDINKYAPYVTPNFAETDDYEELSSPAGKVVYTFESKDPDVKRSSEPNYNEHCVSIPERWRDYFSVQKNTAGGAVNKWNIILRKSLSRDYYEGFDRWVINVDVKDECESSFTSKIGYGTFTVKPTDVNNHQPRFTANCLLLNINEEKEPNEVVKDFTACTYDVDKGNKGQIDSGSYSLEGTRFFRFDSATLEVNEKIPERFEDRIETLSYTFPVKVKDRASLDTASNTINVTVYVNDINNHPPNFKSNYPITFEMDEEMPIGSVVFTLMADDKDIDANALRQYSIEDASPFYMDSLYGQGGGAIRVKDRIDYEAGQDLFKLNVLVSHPDRNSVASKIVNVKVLPINDNAPEITSDSGQNSMIISEDTEPSANVLSTFTGRDRDGDTFDWFIDYENSDVSRRFDIEKRNNLKADLKLIRKLDRETTSKFSLIILAVDNGSPPQTGSLTFTISVEDVNDNAPELVPDKELIVKKSLSSDQELDGVIRIVDRDSNVNREPFTLQGTSCSPNNQACSSFKIVKADDTLRVITSKDSYDRYETKEYYLPVVMVDSGNPAQTGTSTLTIIVEGENKSPQEKGARKSVIVYNFKYRMPDASIGTPYSEDKDDWDLQDKQFELLSYKDFFEIVNDNTKPDHGHVKLKEGTKAGEYELRIRIKDNTRPNDVVESTMLVTIVYLDEQAVKNPGSMTLTGITAEQFIEGTESKKEKLKNSLATILGTSTDNVEIFSVYNSGHDITQILYAAHGSPWYDKSRLDGLASLNQNKLEKDAGVKISEIPINECDSETLCYVGGCETKIEIKEREIYTINTNFSSQTQVNARAVGVCTCSARAIERAIERCTTDYCMNNGTCIDKFTNSEEVWGEPQCKCLPGFDGSRCQQIDHSFDGKGWAWYEPLALCAEDILSIDIVTTTGTGLIFYQGPLSSDESKDYLALEINNGKPKFTGLYEGKQIILNIPDSKDLADGKWHTLQISKIPTDRKMIRWTLIVDHCKDAIVEENIENSTESDNGCKISTDLKLSRNYLDNINPFQLGGRKSTSYPSGITKNGFNGCMKNVRHNGVLRDLYTGKRREQTSTSDGCPSVSNKCSDCGTNATCEGDLTSAAATCVCKPGFSGPPSCTDRTNSRKFKEKAYFSWNLKPSFNNSLTSIESRRNQRLQLRFRTRKREGTIFSTSSFSTLEQIILSVSQGSLKLLYDLGSGYNTLSLPQITVNDGHWHTVVFERFGNGGTLTLDGGNAPRYFVQNMQTDSHRLIAIDGLDISSGAMLQKKEYHNLPTATEFLESSCISDIQYKWSDSDPISLPLEENNPNADVSFNNRVNTEDGCPSGVSCSDITCPSGAPCVDQWESATCDCGIGRNYSNEACIEVSSCAVPQCINGGLCAFVSQNWLCHCPVKYIGDRCDTKAEEYKEDKTTLSAGGIVGIILAILIALVILTILSIWIKQRKEPEKVIIDHPETDENEFCYNYTEEGGGEEDTANFSTAELRKAVSDHPHEPIKVAEINTGFAPDDPPYRSPVSPFGPDGKPKNLGDFLSDRLTQADNDPTAPPYDTVREYEYEGGASQTGSLSSLASGSTDASIDYEPYMQGPRFDKLRDIYSGNDDTDNFPIDDSLA